MNVQIIINNKGVETIPIVVGDVSLQSYEKGSPAVLKFSVLKDATLNFTEGNMITLVVDDMKLFKGYVFIKNRNKNGLIEVTAYDQLRYLKNKDTYNYSDKTASELIKMIADDFKLKCGAIDDTKYKIPSRVEENSTLFDIIQTALDLTNTQTGDRFVMYDDYGEITLKNMQDMQLDVMLDGDVAEDYNYSSSIDDNTYNKVKLVYENKDKGIRNVYIKQDDKNINSWGVLQLFETLKDDINGDNKAELLLDLYNSKTRKLSVSKMFGDVTIRAGCMIPVFLNIGDVMTSNMMIIQKCNHIFSDSGHFMNLTLIGGGFVAG